MADVKKIATRVSLGEGLTALAAEHDDFIVMDADVAMATMTNTFRQKYPERFVDCGIAEANMMSMAAGIATTGRVPFVCSFAMFVVGRVFEQIRNSIGYPHLNVKICSTHGGISAGEDGATHQCNEDLTLMRTIPGMTVICPSDDIEARAALKAAYEHVGPVYLRFGRQPVAVINDTEDYSFTIGKGRVLREGTDVALIACGIMVQEALVCAELLAEEGIQARVINMPTIKPLDESLVLKAAEDCKKVVTIEEHSVLGALGSAVCEVLSEKRPTPVKRIGMQDCYGESGPALGLLDKYGLSGKRIAETVKNWI